MKKLVLITIVSIILTSCIGYYGYNDRKGHFHDYISIDSINENDLKIEVEYLYQSDITKKNLLSSYVIPKGRLNPQINNLSIDLIYKLEDGTTIKPTSSKQTEKGLYKKYNLRDIKKKNIIGELEISFTINDRQFTINKMYSLKYDRSVLWFEVLLGI